MPAGCGRVTRRMSSIAGALSRGESAPQDACIRPQAGVIRRLTNASEHAKLRILQARSGQRRNRNGKERAKPGVVRPAAKRVVTGEQATIREWVEERDKTMAAEFKAHRAETKLDVANLAKEFSKELREELTEARRERQADRATALHRQLWTWGLVAAVGLAVLFGD